MVIAIDLANGSALTAFERSTEAVTGSATHQIVGGPEGVPEAVYRDLRVEGGLRAIAPVVDTYVTTVFGTPRVLRLLGLDPLADATVRAWTPRVEQGLRAAELLTSPGAVLATPGTAGELGIEVGDRFAVEVGGRQHELELIGLIESDQSEVGDDLLLADLATAQEISGALGLLTRIDVVAPEVGGREMIDRLATGLPPGLEIQAASASVDSAREMTAAFRWNLQALSLLALVCGAFLVFNTVTFSIVQRRRLLGILRALGVTRSEIGRAVLIEALILGVLGSLVGLVLGIALASGLVRLVTQTINDLYFVVRVRELSIDAVLLAKGLVLGIGATVAATIAPAREATLAAPRSVMARFAIEARAHRLLPKVTFVGVGLAVAGLLALAVPTDSLVASLASLFVVLSGMALSTPAATVLLARLIERPAGRLFGLTGRLATRGIEAELSRTGVAIAALTVAVSVSIGVGVMTRSFRTTVIDWLDSSLPADLYLSPAKRIGRAPAQLPGDWPGRLRALDGVAAVGTVQYFETRSGGRATSVLGFDIDRQSFSAFSFKEGDPDRAWEAFAAGNGVLVTEPFSYRRELHLGDEVELAGPAGPVRLPIVGVYYDYASERGAVVLHRSAAHRLWQTRTVAGISVRATEGVELATLERTLRLELDDGPPFLVQSNRALRQQSLEVFDRTFKITGILGALATIVAVLGIFAALMALELERSREIGVLRALGLLPGQVWTTISAQTGLMGLISGLLAIPVGWTMAAILVHVINRRAFGWSLELTLSWGFVGRAVIVALVAALAAGLYPAYAISRTSAAEALRGE